MMGSAIATLISYAGMALLLYQKSRAVYPVPYQVGRGMLMILIAAALVMLQPAFTVATGSEWISSLILLLIGVVSIPLIGLLKQSTSNNY
jgi:hypothetical protein